MSHYLVYDTETSGLNIRTDKPFLFVYGTLNKKLQVVTKEKFYTDDLQSKQKFITAVKKAKVIIGHNIKFDVNMAINYGLSLDLFKDKVYIDTAVLARLVVPHDQQIRSNFHLTLKKLSKRFLNKDSDTYEKQVKREFQQLILAHKEKMKQYFIQLGIWDTNLSNTKQTKLINQIYNQWFKYYHNFKGFVEPRKDFLKKNPPPTYADCPTVGVYAMKDLDLTIGLFKLWYPKVIPLGQVEALKRISNATIPLLEMEREGLVVNLTRILNDRNLIVREMKRVKIIDPRNGEQYTVGQHAKLKDLYEYEAGIELQSADKNARASVKKLSQAARKADYLSKLAKYLNTYITNILKRIVVINGEYRIFTQYNLAGTVTGRLSSNFQQFPKDPLELDTGDVINLRAWFVNPADKQYTYYFDYSQMELRLQCEWTNIVNGSPDINMARAFAPYECIKRDGKYYLKEDPKTEWHKIDLHSLTAHHAFPHIDMNDPDWDSKYRKLGKRANFACNYGASAGKLASSLKIPFSEAKALVQGYRKTYKGIIDFGKWLKGRTFAHDWTPNLLLRRYYSRNKHLLQNWVVQGSGADILLEKTYEVWLYIQDKPHWHLMLSVHDEIGLYVDVGIPENIIKKEAEEIQKIMTYKLTAVDIIVDVERTSTCWAEKGEV